METDKKGVRGLQLGQDMQCHIFPSKTSHTCLLLSSE